MDTDRDREGKEMESRCGMYGAVAPDRSGVDRMTSRLLYGKKEREIRDMARGPVPRSISVRWTFRGYRTVGHMSVSLHAIFLHHTRSVGRVPIFTILTNSLNPWYNGE